MSDEELKAKVFISCGQARGSDEREVARRVAEQLRELGYEPYIAVEEQTLRGIKENIFQQLESSEYFIFIDFKRERLATEDQKIYRGSLFSHQELAIASYLNIPVIPFQEIGVKQEDGLLGFLQGNSIPFADRQLLPDLISDAVQQQRWDPHWKNQLQFERKFDVYPEDPELVAGDLDVLEITPYGDDYWSILLPIRNLNLRKTALNCCVYIESIVQLEDDKPIPIPIKTGELSWAGLSMPNATIAPQSYRTFHAFAASWRDFFDIGFITSTGITSPIRYTNWDEKHPRKLAITYAVVSENFPTARASYLFHLRDKVYELLRYEGNMRRLIFILLASFDSIDLNDTYFQSISDEKTKFY